MAAGTTFDEHATFDLDSFRDDSEQLHEFLTLDFSSMDSEISALFAHQRPPLRFVRLVWRVARELAPLYVRRPERTFDGVPSSVVGQLERCYEKNRFDRFMRVLSRQAVVQNTQIVSADPVSAELAKLRVWSPFEANVEFEDPLEEDIRKAKRVDLRIPLTNEDGRVTYGRRVYTQDSAVVTRNDGQSIVRGIFNPDGTNPFDGIPLRAYRREECIKGFYFPAISQDLLALQIGMNLVLSFVEHIGRHQGFTQRTITGGEAKTAAETSYTGPDYVMALAGDDLQLDVHDPNPPTDKTLDALDTTIRLFGAGTYVDVQSLLSKSTGITGDAKAMERQDQDEARRELEKDLESFESEIAGLTLEAMRLKGLKRSQPEDPKVTLDYRYVEPRRNDLQTVQAQEARINLGLDARSRILARESGISVEDAMSTVEENLEEAERLRDMRAEQIEAEPPPTFPSEGDNNLPGE